jgi:hypothetical protein
VYSVFLVLTIFRIESIDSGVSIYGIKSQRRLMSYAALVEFNESTMLSDDEYKLLKCALQLARSEEKEAQAMVYALRGYVEDATPKLKGLLLFFALLMGELGQTCDEVEGMLVGKAKQPILIDDKDNIAAAEALLKILQQPRGWLPDFLRSFRLKMWAEKTPTPLEVMEALTEEAFNFECDISDAKRTMSAWPQFFPKTNEAAGGEIAS